MFWNLEFLGFTDVAVLDGGWNQWQTLNGLDSTTYPIDATPFAGHTPATVPLEVDIQEQFNASGSYLQDVLKDFDPSKVVIFDTRPDYPSEMEFSGLKYKPGTERHGRLPHSKMLWWYDYCDTNTKLMKSPATIIAMHNQLGVTPDKEIITICTIGIRSTFNYLICRLLGFPNVKNALWGMKQMGNEGMAVSTDASEGNSGQFPVERVGLWAPKRDMMAGAMQVFEPNSPVTTHNAVVLAGGIDETGAPTASTHVFDVFRNSVSCAYNIDGLHQILLTQKPGPVTITVDSTAGFPTQGVLIFEEEPIPYTGKTATTFTGCDISTMQYNHRKKKGRVYMDPFNKYSTVTALRVAYDDMPQARHGGASVSFNDALYVFGGMVGGAPSNTILKFDPSAATGSQWTTITGQTLATARSHASASLASGTPNRAFILGGEGPSGAALNTVEVFDLDAEQMDTASVTALPTAKYWASSATEGVFLYTIGGLDGSGTIMSEIARLDTTSLPGTWTQRTAMPTARSHLASSVVAGRIVVTGGQTGSGLLAPTDASEEYDPASDAWKILGGIYQKKYGHAQVTVGEYFCIFGGAHDDPDNHGAPYTVAAEHAQPGSNTTGMTWDSGAVLPSGAPRYAGAVVTSNLSGSDLIYTIGGLNASGTASSAVYVFDGTTWTAGSSLPGARYGHGACVDTTNGYIYVFGGMSGGSSSDEILRFDGTWTTMTGILSVARCGLGAAYHNGNIHVLGGVNASGNAQATHDVYGIASDACVAGTALPNAKKWPAVVTADSSGAGTGWRIYAIGGLAGDGTPLHEVAVYNPSVPGWSFGDLMQTPRGCLCAAVGSNGNVYGFGGRQFVLDQTMASAAFEMYKPAFTGVVGYPAWRIHEDLKPPRLWAGVGALGGNIYVIGGFGGAYSDDPASSLGASYNSVIRHDE